MTFRITIGIDPGASGAIAILHDGTPVMLYDTPVTKRKAGGYEVAASAVVGVLRSIYAMPDEVGAHTSAVLEQVGAMPGNGGSSMFRFGESFGIVKGVLAALRIGYVTVSPPRWKKHFGLIGADKDCSRTLCIQRWPNIAHQLQRKKDNGRSDAVLIARWAWENEMGASA